MRSGKIIRDGDSDSEESGQHVATVATHDGWHEISTDEQAANGRVLAAAPDLLAACKEAAKAIAFSRSVVKSGESFSRSYEAATSSALELIRLALARAEGRAE